MIAINDIFESIHGEGCMTGRPSMFFRLQGCDVGCAWCDAKESWPEHRNFLIDQKTIDKLISLACARHIVITGGEPLMQDISPLVSAAIENGKTVQLETSGTYPLNISEDLDEHLFVTVSPQIGMPGKKPVIVDMLKRADEIKMPIGNEKDVDTILYAVLAAGYTGPVYLQPLWGSENAVKICVEAATKMGWNVSFQVHKLVGLKKIIDRS